MKKLSIIIPVYNCKKYLNECIQPLLGYICSEIELILIDDGSTDGSQSICDGYCKTNENVKVIHQRNHGVSFTRNVGLDMANGEFIMFIDSDDFIDKGSLSFVLSQLDEDIDCLAAGIRYYYENNNEIKEYPLKNVEFHFLHDINDYFNLLNNNYFFSAIYSKIYKKRIIDENNIRFPVEFSIWEDSSFVYEYLSKCNRIRCVDYLFYNYRQTIGESLVKRINRNAVEALLYRYEKSKYLVGYLNNSNMVSFYNTLNYWLITSILKIYYCNSSKINFKELVNICSKNSVKEILANSSNDNLSKLYEMFYYLLKKNSLKQFHLLAVCVGKIKHLSNIIFPFKK